MLFLATIFGRVFKYGSPESPLAHTMLVSDALHLMVEMQWIIYVCIFPPMARTCQIFPVTIACLCGGRGPEYAKLPFLLTNSAYRLWYYEVETGIHMTFSC